MGKLITRAAFPTMNAKLAVAVMLAWLLTGCSSILPTIADKMAHITQLVMTKEAPESSGNELVDRADKAIAEGRTAMAETYLDAALSVDPYDGRALRQLAVIYMLTGRPEKALRYEKLALEIDIIDAGVWAVIEDQPTISDELNNIQRFTALGKILDAGLISSVEYYERREANLGALLPLTQPSPALIPGRVPPRTGDVLERLETINRFNENGALNSHTYALERNIILEGLMPLPKSEHRTTAVVVTEALDPEVHQKTIDHLLETKLISPGEYKKEGAVLVGLYSPAAAVMDEDTMEPAIIPDETVMESADESKGSAETRLSALVAEGAATLDETPAFAPPLDSIARINIHLALSRTPESAKHSWDNLQQANSLTLDGLTPHVSRVDLGGRKGVFFQLSAGPLVNMAAAEALCDELLSRDFYCAPLVF